MYKIIIVDDEILLRQGFISMTDWSNVGFQVAGEASNGREALKLIEKVHPDIVITDIRMPIMNGIELTRIIKEQYPEIEIIILSSYNDFEYVKETLKIGALDYILKSKMRYKELINVLQKATVKINKKPLFWKSQEKNELTSSHNAFFRNLVNGKFPDSQNICYYFNKFAINLQSKNLMAIIFKLDLSSNLKDSPSEPNIVDNDITVFLSNYIGHEMKDKYTSYTFNYNSDTIICLLNISSDGIENLDGTCHNIIAQIHHNYNINSWILWSPAFDDYFNISVICKSTINDLQYCFYKEKNNVYKTSDFANKIEAFDIDYKHLNNLIEAMDFELVKDYPIQEITKIITENKHLEPYVLKKVIIEIYNFIMHKLPDIGLSTDEISHNKFNYFKAIDDSNSFRILMQIFDNILCEILQNVYKSKYNKYGLTLNSIVDYLRKNYSEDISLASVAELFHLNKNYLCQLFKQKTGKNFHDYIIQIRIEKAKELLRQSNQNISVICELVGFANPSYFAKTFKETVGMKPSEYSKIFND
jgi:two-component system response regulator YesN